MIYLSVLQRSCRFFLCNVYTAVCLPVTWFRLFVRFYDKACDNFSWQCYQFQFHNQTESYFIFLFFPKVMHMFILEAKHGFLKGYYLIRQSSKLYTYKLSENIFVSTLPWHHDAPIFCWLRNLVCFLGQMYCFCTFITFHYPRHVFHIFRKSNSM